MGYGYEYEDNFESPFASGEDDDGEGRITISAKGRKLFLSWIEGSLDVGFDWDLILTFSEAGDPEALRERWRWLRYLDSQMLLNDFPSYIPDLDEDTEEEMKEDGITSREIFAGAIIAICMPVCEEIQRIIGVKLRELIEGGGFSQVWRSAFAQDYPHPNPLENLSA